MVISHHHVNLYWRVRSGPAPAMTLAHRMPERVIDELQKMPPGASAPSHQYYRATLVQSDLIGFTSALVLASFPGSRGCDEDKMWVLYTLPCLPAMGMVVYV